MDSNFPLNFEEFSSVWPQYCFLDFADHLTVVLLRVFLSFFIFYLKLCSVDLSLFILLISKRLILSPVTGELSK